MEQLKSIDEYSGIQKQLKQEKKRFVNDSLLIDEVKRYVELNRMWHITNEAGSIFLLDEETYYRAILCIDAGKPWEMEKVDKPVLIRSRYKKGKKKESVLKLEEQIKKNGFEFQDTGVLMRFDVAKAKEKSLKEFNRAKKILDKFHYKIGPATIEQYDEIQELFEQQDMILNYHEPYKTEEEIKERFERNEYTCISDENGKVLVYSSSYLLNGHPYSDRIIAREEYRMSGLTPILMHYAISRTKYDILAGSVLTHNDASIKTCTRIGWQITDRCCDYWLLK